MDFHWGLWSLGLPCLVMINSHRAQSLAWYPGQKGNATSQLSWREKTSTNKRPLSAAVPRGAKLFGVKQDSVVPWKEGLLYWEQGHMIGNISLATGSTSQEILCKNQNYLFFILPSGNPDGGDQFVLLCPSVHFWEEKPHSWPGWPLSLCPRGAPRILRMQIGILTVP